MFNPLPLLGFGGNDDEKTTDDRETSNDCPESQSGHDFVFQTYYDAYTEADEPVFEDGESEYTKQKTAMFECTLCGEVDLRKGDEERVSGDDVADEFDMYD